jgi:hypothetical protein
VVWGAGNAGDACRNLFRGGLGILDAETARRKGGKEGESVRDLGQM